MTYDPATFALYLLTGFCVIVAGWWVVLTLFTEGE